MVGSYINNRTEFYSVGSGGSWNMLTTHLPGMQYHGMTIDKRGGIWVASDTQVKEFYYGVWSTRYTGSNIKDIAASNSGRVMFMQKIGKQTRLFQRVDGTCLNEFGNQSSGWRTKHIGGSKAFDFDSNDRLYIL